MSRNLVIVESATKAKTIEKILGEDYKVVSCVGHISDLPVSEIGVDVDNDFKPKYIIPDEKKQVIKDLKKHVKQSEKVWLASDEDREGEAIAWHLYENLNLSNKESDRIVFHEITKNAILKALDNPRSIDYNLVNAQQARRVLDRLVGYELSPVLWKKVKTGLSAGRVQSVCVRVIVEREREIQKHESKSTFKTQGIFNNIEGKSIKSELDTRFNTDEEIRNFLIQNENATFHINSLSKKPSKRSPTPPFTTSTLQQEASRKLGFGVSRTMSTAQKLYEAGLITYMRTDSVTISNEAKALAHAGCFAVVLECVPSVVGKLITESIDIPTIGIGASKFCDGQILVIDDMLGLSDYYPKFVKKYSNLKKIIDKCVKSYVKEVKARRFPSLKNVYK